MDGADRLGEPVGLACAAPSFSARSPAILLLCAAIVVSGRGVDGSAAPTVAVEHDRPRLVGPGQPTDEADEAVGEPADEPAAAELPAGATGAADAAAAQPGALAACTAIPPRRPLSPLGQARRRTPTARPIGTGRMLYQPVATAAGTHRGDGLYRLRSPARRPSAPDEICSYRRHRLAVRLRARTAFRALLRGRAVSVRCRQRPSQQLRSPAAGSASRMSAPGWSTTAGRGLPRADPMPRPARKAGTEQRQLRHLRTAADARLDVADLDRLAYGASRR